MPALNWSQFCDLKKGDSLAVSWNEIFRKSIAIPTVLPQGATVRQAKRQSVESEGKAINVSLYPENAVANDLGNLRRYHLVPAFVSGSDAL
jgi:hypothetical protein